MSTCLREVSLSVITACGVVLLAPMPAVYAVNYTTTGGNWDTTTIWTPNGDPGSGDSVFLNGAVSVSAGNEFGTASLDSFWTSGNLSIFSSVTLRQTTGTMTFNSSSDLVRWLVR